MKFTESILFFSFKTEVIMKTSFKRQVKSLAFKPVGSGSIITMNFTNPARVIKLWNYTKSIFEAHFVMLIIENGIGKSLFKS